MCWCQNGLQPEGSAGAGPARCRGFFILRMVVGGDVVTVGKFGLDFGGLLDFQEDGGRDPGGFVPFDDH